MNKTRVLFIATGLVVLGIIPFIGIVEIDTAKLFEPGSSSFIFWNLRVPRTILGFVTGSSLALAGLVFQNIFRNSLATPYTLGVSSGASAGVILAIQLHLPLRIMGFSEYFLFGFAGALLSIFLILGIARAVKNYSIYTLLMSGVAINFFFSSLIAVVQYISSPTETMSILRWLLGGLAGEPLNYRRLWMLIPFYLIFVSLVFFIKNELVIVAAGDDFAFSKGLDLRKFRLAIFVGVSVIVGLIVSYTGPIGFIGLIVPHISRMLFKGNFRAVIFASLLVGGIFLSVSDFLARILIPGVEIPVGIITALTGAPFFIFVLISTLRRKT